MTAVDVPQVPARLVFAGGEWTEAPARVIERTPAWRRSSALIQLGLWLLASISVLDSAARPLGAAGAGDRGRAR